MPAAIGQAIDAGVSAARHARPRSSGRGSCSALGVIQAVAGILRHRCAVFNWLSAAYRTVQVTVRQAGRLGATLPKRLATGEVVSIGTSDISHIGNAIDITARGTGAVVGDRHRRGDPAERVGAAGPGRGARRAGADGVVGAAHPAAAPPPAGLPGPAGDADHPGRRHRHRAAGAARRRRRGDLRRPLPGRVADGPGARACGSPGSSRCWRRRRCCCPASSWRS